MSNSIEAREAYNIWHAELGVDAEADTPWHRILKPMLLREDLVDKQVLEIGCGRGDFSCWLAKNAGAHLSAADFSHTAVAKGRAYAATLGLTIRWQVMDIQSIGGE